MFIRNINKLPLAALLIMIGIASASSASANAGHHNVAGPDVRDAGTVRNAPTSNTGTCYTEPTGFHTNIHWDGACRYPNHLAEAQRNQPAKVDVEPVKEQRPSHRIAKCKWTNVHCSGM